MYWTPQIIYYIIISICLLLSLSVYFRQSATFYLKLIPPFLCLTIIENIWALILDIRVHNNHIVHNFYSVLFFSFYGYLLSQIIQHPRVKKVIIHTCWIFPLIALSNIFFGQGLHNFHTITHSLGASIFISFCGWYFMELAGSDRSFAQASTEPGFWICTGLSLFYPITFVYFGSVLFIANVSTTLVQYLGIVVWIGNYLLYTSFAIGFYYFIKNSQPKKMKPRTNKA